AKISKVAAEKALETYIKVVGTELRKTGRLSLVGFGTFTCARRKARMGRNPKTGATIKIPARKVVKFKSGKTLSELVSRM
ncbi:MAG: HU family DNA-binding protein, partial [Deltaproteobacteria bacterium]|nr:HU family DNA-binding protein [Deltaproteobacteria bacterium]